MPNCADSTSVTGGAQDHHCMLFSERRVGILRGPHAEGLSVGPSDRFSRGAMLLALAMLPFDEFSAREICIGSASGAAATTIAVPVRVSDGLDVVALQVEA